MVTNLSGTEGRAEDSAVGSLHANVSGEGPPVVLLHGLFGMGSNLGALARSLADRYRVHQLDLPNHGRSPWAEVMGLAEMAEAVVAYIETLDHRVRLVGHSLGGKVAMQIAMNHGELLAALVVADIAPVAYPSSHDRVFAAIADVAARAPRSRGEAAAIMGQWIEEDGVAQFLLLSLRRDDDGVYRWRLNGEGLKANYGAMRQPPLGRPYSGPSLFIYGARSSYVDARGIEAARALFPRATFESLDNAGHWLHVEKPAEFNGAVGSFLAAADVEVGS